MILVDTSIWVDHLRDGDAELTNLLDGGMVVTHPFVVGELALGVLRQRETVLASLQDLPKANVASDDEVLRFIDEFRLNGRGIGYVDSHLLAATRLTSDASLWTRDKKLLAVANALSLAAPWR